jgi:ferredoxin-type protein NapH
MKIISTIGLLLFLLGLGFFSAGLLTSQHELNSTFWQSNKQQFKPAHLLVFEQEFAPLYGQTFHTNVAFLSAFEPLLTKAKDRLDTEAKTPPQGISEWDIKLSDYDIKNYKFVVTKYSTTSMLAGGGLMLFLLSFGSAMLGGLLYFLPNLSRPAGIQHNGIFESSALSRGWIGIATGIYLIGFYVVLYWYPQYLTNATRLVDNVSQVLTGGDASQWFLYGFIYCSAMSVMSVKLFIKYRHNKYQIIRTCSVLFFQIGFAFLLPNIMYKLGQPYMDLKEAFPLDYAYFYDYKIEQRVGQGADLGLFKLGTVMFVWGIVFSIVIVPLMTYLYGKRWYCSWVCGCGGLAETAGDGYRQLSNKSTKAWRLERYSIYTVLALVLVMTVMVLITYIFGISQFWLVSSYQVRDWYGFLIGATFSGVVGTGFYPLLGNRVWCRFGCPLAAVLGIIQRWKSRFRITSNGGQCISCGNCSTYCEMGIDVRSYAQKGQDIIRASCVGCGVCSAVCPRGVLKLETMDLDISERSQEHKALHISKEGIKLVP